MGHRSGVVLREALTNPFFAIEGEGAAYTMQVQRLKPWRVLLAEEILRVTMVWYKTACEGKHTLTQAA
ncbi:hypothetical protein RRF57_005256 [Xylaria bambusicola]|uniref:Uncharacterized protein n=1 Tax=Xylaria bambusicola TaxID=326684 RepID=A0AAN7Z959_9PEZI